MAIDVKKIIADALLILNQAKHLDNITVKNILEKSNVSRRTFYNHFKDKNDLIQYIYDEYIIPDFKQPSTLQDFESSMVNTLTQMKQYQTFMKQACLMEGQNCLKDYIYNHCQSFDLAWHEYLYGSDLPETLRFATIYHSNASTSMVLSWILSDMVVAPKEMAQMITNMRAVGMDILFKEGKNNPYLK